MLPEDKQEVKVRDGTGTDKGGGGWQASPGVGIGGGRQARHACPTKVSEEWGLARSDWIVTGLAP